MARARPFTQGPNTCIKQQHDDVQANPATAATGMQGHVDRSTDMCTWTVLGLALLLLLLLLLLLQYISQLG
jgi:type VI protein secretion system component VasF